MRTPKPYNSQTDCRLFKFEDFESSSSSAFQSSSPPCLNREVSNTNSFILPIKRAWYRYAPCQSPWPHQYTHLCPYCPSPPSVTEGHISQLLQGPDWQRGLPPSPSLTTQLLAPAAPRGRGFLASL
ncbi:hypothetical protein ACOMHN_058072 [Nucella lapillus]